MLERLREEISVLIGQISRMNYSFRIQNYDAALRQLSGVLAGLDDFYVRIEENRKFFEALDYSPEMVNILENLNLILNAQEQEDYVLIGDLFELSVMPFLKELQGMLISQAMLEAEACGGAYPYDREKAHKSISGLICEEKQRQKLLGRLKEAGTGTICATGYRVEFTSCGEMTVVVNTGERERYFHSNGEVRAEAHQLAISWYREEKGTYLVYGLGLGYHIDELAHLSEGVLVEVYESDPNIILLASAYGTISHLLELANVKVVYDPEFAELTSRLNQIKEDEELVLHYPSLLNIHDSRVREKLEEYFIQFSSVKNQLPLLNQNFRSNIMNYDSSADILSDKFKDRDVYIVAAGPSLDKNCHLLKERESDSIVIATGTVLKKLLAEGIRPDYFVVSDANARVYAQINGIEHLDIPMLLLSTAYKGFATNYQGKKYLLLQEEFVPAEQYAGQKGLKLFETGGSVSTTALDAAIKLGGKRIIFLGLDLAYTDNYVHASNTSRRDLSDSKDLREVLDISGKKVYTSRSLLIYRKWIERHIGKFKDIEFLNATEGGIPIEGMRNVRLRDI